MITTALIERFYQGALAFSDIADRYPELTTTDIAKRLDMPMAYRVIAVRHSWAWWQMRDVDAIHAARIDYDAGRCELAQTKFVGHFLLYNFPRRIVTRTRMYFRSPFEMTQ